MQLTWDRAQLQQRRTPNCVLEQLELVTQRTGTRSDLTQRASLAAPCLLAQPHVALTIQQTQCAPLAMVFGDQWPLTRCLCAPIWLQRDRIALQDRLVVVLEIAPVRVNTLAFSRA